MNTRCLAGSRLPPSRRRTEWWYGGREGGLEAALDERGSTGPPESSKWGPTDSKLPRSPPPMWDSSKCLVRIRFHTITFTPYTIWTRHCDLQIVALNSVHPRCIRAFVIVKLAAHFKIQTDAATRDRDPQYTCTMGFDSLVILSLPSLPQTDYTRD